MSPALLIYTATLAGGLTQSVAPAEHVEYTARASAGSGVSLAGADGKTLAARSPTFLVMEAGLRLDNLAWLELNGGLMLEVEGRVSVGVVPRVRAYLPTRRLKLYGLAGAPFVVYPFTLFGAQGGMGLQFDVHKHVGVLVEFVGTGFFGGSDLMAGSALGKLDAVAGVRLAF